ncbi:MAG TPA: hypothetical protein VEO01_11275, partial [Pseudonocardiaceae bacterium]|nr:hypothetical protein [Pseudonocardiaceae bacterium]
MTTEPVFNPVTNAVPTPQLRHHLDIACSRAGLSPSGAQLLHYYANAVWLLPQHPAIARVTYSALAHHKARVNVAVCRWLVDQHGFPATEPLTADVVEVDAHTAATFWIYYPQPDDTTPSSAHLGHLLRRLHALPQPP